MTQPGENVALPEPSVTGSTSLERLIAQRHSIRIMVPEALLSHLHVIPACLWLGSSVFPWLLATRPSYLY